MLKLPTHSGFHDICLNYPGDQYTFTIVYTLEHMLCNVIASKQIFGFAHD